jgi:hypothetical protein
MAENYAVSQLLPLYNDKPGPGGYEVFAQSAIGDIPLQPGCKLVNEPSYYASIYLDEAPLAIAATLSALVVNETLCERCEAQPLEIAFAECCYLPGLSLDYGSRLTKNSRYYEAGMRCCLNCLAECFRVRANGGDNYFAELYNGGDP